MRVYPLVTRAGRFDNPFSTWRGLPPVTALGKLLLEFTWESILLTTRRGGGAPGSTSRTQLAVDLPILKPTFATENDTKEAPYAPRLRYHWLGHATVLWQFVEQDVNILCDPIFSKRASSSAWIGPKRYVNCVCEVEDLPRIDIVAISHNHMDHLDIRTLKELERRFGGSKYNAENHDGAYENGQTSGGNRKIKYVVPMGLKSWLEARMGLTGEGRVTELTWWESQEVPSPTAGGKVKLQFVPAQHWSGRTLLDRFKSLWGGWLLSSGCGEDEGRATTAYFAGDTGWAGEAVFKSIANAVEGQIDVAAVPIGAYAPRDFMMQQHVTPEEAHKVFTIVNAKEAFGIHWGTFPLTFEHYMEPKARLDALGDERFFTLGHGESRTLQ
eukprot:Plantae.Rhodophyta-Hildenbrandia_rubra.ctg22145.p1 GENE.Plantae.Rhodophyta-Hildenbrandia_rubra.ctg22145~~Plantae.Rhodophyta-Hildenbrandia_rubra.ctg22145.p1  ORF type:complete len:384 (+),score=39.86 Plantae.Rhodophyta-Hildenbrandia_rubra.ctg22145:375-1526(+)